jgi:hypothetical protein
MSAPGEPTAASAAIASGDPALAASFRFHRPRGPLCGRGYCAQCEIETSNGPALACCTPPDQALPRGRDRLRPLGRVAERYPPWFYERRFLHPRRLRRIPLHALRYLSAAPPLGPAAAAVAPRAFREREAEVVVVGDAPAPDGAVRVPVDRALGVYPDRTLGVLEADALVALRFDRLILATGSYERLPPVPGNDLPGVIGLPALERYAAAGALAPGRRVAIWAPMDEPGAMHELVARHRLQLAWCGPTAPRRIIGDGRVTAVDVGERVPCDLFVVGVRQPAIELALQAGARAGLTTGELPILALDDRPDWLTVIGEAAGSRSGVPNVVPDDEAFACACEDVRVGDLRACVAQGFDQAELVKRRTGAMTGPCQGKLCASAVLTVLRQLGLDAEPTTARPLARPVSLADLAADA